MNVPPPPFPLGNGEATGESLLPCPFLLRLPPPCPPFPSSHAFSFQQRKLLYCPGGAGPSMTNTWAEHSPVHSFGFSEQQVLEKAPENRASLQLPCCLSSTGPKKMVRTYSRSLSHTVVLRKPPRFHPGRATLHREIWKLLHHDCHYRDTFHSLAMFQSPYCMTLGTEAQPDTQWPNTRVYEDKRRWSP